MVLFTLFATGVIDIVGKFAAGVVDTGGNVPQMLLTPAANLPLVSLTLLLIPVVHLDLQYHCESGAWGKIIHEKNLQQKIS